MGVSKLSMESFEYLGNSDFVYGAFSVVDL
jgi:hypothetical protein